MLLKAGHCPRCHAQLAVNIGNQATLDDLLWTRIHYLAYHFDQGSRPNDCPTVIGLPEIRADDDGVAQINVRLFTITPLESPDAR